MATATATPPWSDWTLDKQFLTDLDGWLKAHPGHKLDTILDKISKAIESGNNLMSFIPDSPFPARSLLHGLGGLIKLGNTIRKAKPAAIKFAQKIVLWIEDILKTFREGDVQQFTVKAWNNLDNVRTLVDEICLWAQARLEDRWWSRNTHKFTVEGEIQEFQAQLEEATGHFMHLSMINLSIGQDAILKGHILLLEKIDKVHDDIKKAHEKGLEDIQAFSGYVRERRLQEQYIVVCSILAQIILEAHDYIQDLALIEKELTPYVASNSAYREQGKEFCYPGTRLELLTKIKDWVSNISGQAGHFLWLTGEPGSGKSTIVATVCRDLKDKNCLWAQLFINRNYLNTTNPKFFFPSIAFQLAKRSPEVAHLISQALQAMPSLTDEVNETLAEQLFVQPLMSASKATPLQAIVVVVDALDECDSNILAKILSNTTRLAANVKVLISSREENVIVQLLWAARPDTKHLSAGTINPSSIQDVEFFLRHQIQSIAMENELDNWPQEEDMQILCRQASGLFIWAATAIKYIRSQILIFGSECLDEVLHQLNMNGMGDINLLYSTILQKMYSGETNPWAFETFRRIIGSIVVLNTPFSIGTLKKILDLRRAVKHPPVDVIHFVRRFRTVLVAGTDQITRDTIPRLHKSFVEYVTSNNTSPDLQVSPLLSHKELAPKCLVHSTNVGDPYFHAARASYQWIVDTLPDDDPDILEYLKTCGNLELSDYQNCGEVASLDKSISVFIRFIGLSPDKAPYLSKLSTLYRFKYQRLGDLADLESALQNIREAVSITPAGHPELPGYLQSLAVPVLDRYQRLGDSGDLEEVLQLIQKALDLTPDRNSSKPVMLKDLSHSFLTRFKHFGDPADLKKSVSIADNAIQLTPTDNPKRPLMLSSLGCSLLAHFQLVGDLTALDKSVSLAEEADHLTPVGSPDKPLMLNNLNCSRLTRFEQLGDPTDLNKSVFSAEDVIQLTSDRPDRPLMISSLCRSLLARFQRFGDPADLDKSVSLAEDAVYLTPDGCPDKSSMLNDLSRSLLTRFEHSGDIADINKSVLVARSAIELTPIGHPKLPLMISSLCCSLLARFRRLGDLANLDESVSLADKAVHLTPDYCPDKPLILKDFSCALLRRFEVLDNGADLHMSISLAEAAANLTPDGHPNKSLLLINVGHSLFCRFRLLNDSVDLQQAIHHYACAASSKTGSAQIRFEGATKWAECAKTTQHSSILHAYQMALDLLPELAWLGLSFSNRHNHLLKAGEVVRNAAAAATAAGQPEKAVEWLEQGRSVVWTQLLDLRTPVNTLEGCHPELADRLVSLSGKLEASGVWAPGSPQSVKDWAHQNAYSREEVLKQIRDLDGFSHFLSPKPIAMLVPAAQGGPVVILNITDTRCDALILVSGLDDSKVMQISLNDFKLEYAESLAQDLHGIVHSSGRLSGKRESRIVEEDDLRIILLKLWLLVVKPVLDGLAITTPTKTNLPRIWWCPTGPLSFLPIHAAGFYGRGEEFGSKLSDYVISSYTPSLTALVNGFRHSHESPKPPRLLIAAASSAPGMGTIPGAEKEVDRIEQLADGKVPVLRLEGNIATSDILKQGMVESSWAHFACHGVQNASLPTESQLMLDRIRLTLSDIIQLDLPHARLAFLSASETATGDKRLPEESIHLAAGMLFAGYRGVIATMWTFIDMDGPLVTGAVYQYLFKTSPPDPTQAAEALHWAIQKLREESPTKKLLHWLPFIHVGV